MMGLGEDQAENLQLLERCERQLRLQEDENDDREVDAFYEWDTPVQDLWTVVLDVVFAPLVLRIRAAELLSAFCAGMDPSEAAAVVHVDTQDVHKLRALVSSSCQVLEELDALSSSQSAQLFAWLGFLERVLFGDVQRRGKRLSMMKRTLEDKSGHTLSQVDNVWLQCGQVLQNSMMYNALLTKMLRLLTVCSTKVFAAVTVCLALFHSHERQCGHSVLVGEVLHDAKDGREHLGGALLHVINSCGCPCPKQRLVHLCNALQLFGDILADETASALVFVNDLKVLVDLVIRECTDLPQEDSTRLHYLELLERILRSPLYLQTQMYRKRDLWALLESLLGAGAAEDSLMSKEVVDKIKRILVRYVDLLD